MAVSENTGNTTTTDGTEQTLATITSAGTYLLALDLNALVNGDIVEFRIYTKVRTGASSRLCWMATYANVQADPNPISIPVPATTEFKATMKRVGGSDRAIIWSVYQL